MVSSLPSAFLMLMCPQSLLVSFSLSLIFFLYQLEIGSESEKFMPSIAFDLNLKKRYLSLSQTSIAPWNKDLMDWKCYN